jgi:hypothetical protein
MLRDTEVGDPFVPRNRAERRRWRHVAKLRPRYISIDDGYRYAGIGRSKFYKDFLWRLRTVRIGRRHVIELDSLDELLDQLTSESETGG